MSDSDSDSSIERVLGKDYSFLRHTIAKDIVKTSPPPKAIVPDSGKKDIQVSTASASTSVVPEVVPDSVDIEKTIEMPKIANARYGKLSLEELSSIADRVKIFSEVGVVVPEKTVPCKNKSKPNNRKTQKIQPAAKKRKNTYGKGKVGTTCTSYGVKRCLCCNFDNDNISRKTELDLARVRAMTEASFPFLMNAGVGHQSPLREIPRNDLTTSTPLSRPVKAKTQETRVGNNSLDISDISVATPGTNETHTQSEQNIMEYVNHLLGETGNSIVAEVEERYQRLQENRLAASDALSNAITVDHDEEMDFDHSVILVGESSPEPIPIDDSVVEVNDAVDNKSTQNRQTIDLTDQPSENNISTVNKDGKSIQRNARECPICVEELANKDISATTCGHVFCTSCIREAVKISKLCPICRTKLTQSKIHRLYCLL
uniref:RING-type domain-containing protein n=2 Tax=Photinus pyralis TaxID=7054 RepID=A0A1Y1M9H3_PHOPY